MEQKYSASYVSGSAFSSYVHVYARLVGEKHSFLATLSLLASKTYMYVHRCTCKMSCNKNSPPSVLVACELPVLPSKIIIEQGRMDVWS